MGEWKMTRRDRGPKLLHAFKEWASEQVKNGEAEPYVRAHDDADGWACLDANFDLNAIATMFLNKLATASDGAQVEIYGAEKEPWNGPEK
jgi:hypothetical protein